MGHRFQPESLMAEGIPILPVVGEPDLKHPLSSADWQKYLQIHYGKEVDLDRLDLVLRQCGGQSVSAVLQMLA